MVLQIIPKFIVGRLHQALDRLARKILNLPETELLILLVSIAFAPYRVIYFEFVGFLNQLLPNMDILPNAVLLNQLVQVKFPLFRRDIIYMCRTI